MDELETEVRRLCQTGDLHAATTAVIQRLGPELLGFLVVVVRDPAEAGDVFADLCVRMWKGLGTFRWESSLRTWAYAIARRACHAHLAARESWRGRHVRLSEVPEIDEMIARVRTTTLASLQRRQTRAERLRAQLTPDEQVLITLRVDRELEWREIARVVSDDEDLTDADITRIAAGLRKRFERIKEKLKQLADEDA
jgi:RNA polymerase sigma-70 factor (ECF subfamily)